MMQTHTFHLFGSLSRIQGCHLGPGPGIPLATMSMNLGDFVTNSYSESWDSSCEKS